ncbi:MULTISPECIES: hypothetical protein [unclassified Rhizobium]|uniref:hypothetical protein n=1 Tax=unclassified Rhizobium TaxID=2613769 RepID=UPI0025FDDE21|nr:hypothetical protein [Rhizobium sp. UBA1881]
MRDQSASIAKFIMHAEQLDDQRLLIFDIAKVFHNASGEEIKRGMLIALEIYEATEVANHVD